MPLMGFGGMANEIMLTDGQCECMDEWMDYGGLGFIVAFQLISAIWKSKEAIEMKEKIHPQLKCLLNNVTHSFSIVNCVYILNVPLLLSHLRMIIQK
jgi:hypothetical protein